MKLSIKGRVGQQEILELISKTLNMLEHLGVEEYQGVNFYFNPYKDGENLVLQTDTGPIESIRIGSDKKHLQMSEVDGVKMQSFKTGVDPDVDFSSRLTIQCGELTVISTKELKRLEAEADRLYRQREAERVEAHRKILEEKQRVRDEQKAVEKRCFDHLKELYGLSYKQLSDLLVSRNWLVSRKGIAKYTDKDLGDNVHRIKVRSTTAGAPSTVYLFSPGGELLESVTTEN